MPGMTSDGSVETLLDRLAALLPPSDRGQLLPLRERLRSGRLRVLVAGESKRGKSTLINALLRRAILPAGVLPLTSVTTTVAAGDHDEVEATFLDGGRVTYAGFGVLADLVTEAGNPGNARGVSLVTVRTRHPLLAAGLELVDTPGTGSVHEHNSGEARRATQDMDLAIFVVSAAPPVSASEYAFLRDIREYAVETPVVLTKTDLLDPDELSAVRDFTADVVGRALGRIVRVHPTSARQTLDTRTRADAALGASSGLPDLVRTLHSAASDRARLLHASIAEHGARLAAAASTDAELTARAVELDADTLSGRQRELTARLAAVRTLAGESAALLDADIRRLVAETTQDARAEGEQAVAVAQAAADQWAGSHPHVRGRDLEDGALTAGMATAARRVTAWRERRHAELDGHLAAVATRLEHRLADQVDAVRTAATDIFDLPSGPAEPVATLTSQSSFRLAGAEQAGPTDLLAAAVRTRLPGRLGSRRVLAHVRSDLALAVEGQYGRARADFQGRLQETGRQLATALRTRVADAVRRVQDAVDRGARLAALQAEDRNRGAADEWAHARVLDELADAFRSSVIGSTAVISDAGS